jgi:hypothetical protein
MSHGLTRLDANCEQQAMVKGVALVLPRGNVKSHLAVFDRALELVQADYVDREFVRSVLPHLARRFRARIANLPENDNPAFHEAMTDFLSALTCSHVDLITPARARHISRSRVNPPSALSPHVRQDSGLLYLRLPSFRVEAFPADRVLGALMAAPPTCTTAADLGICCDGAALPLV